MCFWRICTALTLAWDSYCNIIFVISVMQSTGRVEKNVVKNSQFPVLSRYLTGGGWGGGWDFFDFRCEDLNLYPTHPPGGLELLMDNFDILETSPNTGRLPSHSAVNPHGQLRTFGGEAFATFHVTFDPKAVCVITLHQGTKLTTNCRCRTFSSLN